MRVDTPTRAQFLQAFDGVADLRPKIDEIASQYADIITLSAPGEAPVGLHFTGDFCFNGIWTVHGSSQGGLEILKCVLVVSRPSMSKLSTFQVS